MYESRLFIFFGSCLLTVSSITNNADLIWYEKDAEDGHNYFARSPFPEGLIRAQKIVVNQKMPLLWEVKFAFFDNLEALVIDDCGVKEIRPDTFKDLKPLTNLSLRLNNIKEIKEGVFNNIQIKRVDLSKNKISILAPKAFDDMPVLEVVILDFNELRQWNSDWFFNCANIKTVSITHNFLEELPEKAFKNFRQLDVYFSFNKIKRIDPDTFAESGHFGDLFLDWNDLDGVDGRYFDKLTGVHHLNLNGDSLQCLSDEFLNNVLNKTEILSVEGQPLKCECLKELKSRAKNIEIKLKLPSVDCQ